MTVSLGSAVSTLPGNPDPGFAPAKINLALHVTGQQANGYHLLDTLVVFADIGDRLSLVPNPRGVGGKPVGLEISGPFSSQLLGDSNENLVLKAARLLSDALLEKGIKPTPVVVHLEKNLPLASGVGGGSADAAAALRLLAGYWKAPSDTDLNNIAAGLGADVPMCLASKPLRARGTGTSFQLLDHVPQFHMVLVNPGLTVSTPDVFRALSNKCNPPIPDGMVDEPLTVDALRSLRNDLEAPAIAKAPVVAEVLDVLANSTNCLIARMSGSGATCFGIYGDGATAQTAADTIAAAHPQWWVEATVIKEVP